jgi:hypothetical protein
MKVKIIQTTSTEWVEEIEGEGQCIGRTLYSIMYQKSFLGIKYWVYLKAYGRGSYKQIVKEDSEEKIKEKLKKHIAVTNCYALKPLIIIKNDVI